MLGAEVIRWFSLTVATLSLGGNAAFAQENASNPLAAVNNTDLRWQYTSNDGSYRHDLFVDGAYMLMPELKLKYELHYNLTNITGIDEQDFEKVVLKPIYFPYQTQINKTWGMRAAIGLDFIIEFGNQAKGIGVGADQIGPFLGAAFANTETGLTLIPLIQHFTSVNGPTDINQTALRIIGLKPFADDYWVKLDTRIPYDWENDRWPLSAEAQVGMNINESVAIYADGLVGIGDHRPFDAGIGLGLRFKY
mgnify:CR=1 FL=1